MLIALREKLFLQDINTTPIEPKTERAYVVAVNSCFVITVVRQDGAKTDRTKTLLLRKYIQLSLILFIKSIS